MSDVKWVVVILALIAALLITANRGYQRGYKDGSEKVGVLGIPVVVPPAVEKAIQGVAGKADPNLDTVDELQKGLLGLETKLRADARTIAVGDQITMQCGLIPGRQKGNMECRVVQIR